MYLKRVVLTTAVLLWAVSASHEPTAARQDSTADLAPMLTVRLTGVQGRDRATGSTWLVRDEWREVVAFAGRRGAARESLCGGGIWVAVTRTTDVPPGEDPAVVWTVGARLVEFTGDTAVIDLRWQRTPRDTSLEPATSYERQVRWNVREGNRTVLDAVYAAAAEPACVATAVSAEFSIGSAPRFLHAAIEYDAWLVQRLADGRTRTHHVRTMAAQGATAHVFFPVVALGTPRPGVPSLKLHVSGDIRGRLRTDGSIDVSVDAARFIGSTDSGLATGVAGRSRLRMALGETVEFHPPPLMGALGGVDLETLTLPPTAIRLRARRLW